MNNEFVVGAVLIFLLSLFLFSVGYGGAKLSCHSTASAMSLESDFGIFSGCTYHLKDGTRVNADNYRVL